MSNTSTQVQQRTTFVPAEFFDDVDVAECALDEQLEQLHRQYAAASRASSRAKFELELLESRDDIPAQVLAQAATASATCSASKVAIARCRRIACSSGRRGAPVTPPPG